MTKIWHPERSTLLDFQRGEDCVIHSHVWIGNNVKIGNRVKIQAFAFLPDGVVLEDDVFIGPHVCFTNDPVPPSKSWKQTIVESGAVIGAGAVIVAGVRIAAGAKIGAGAVVTKNVPAGAWWVGNPARPIA